MCGTFAPHQLAKLPTRLGPTPISTPSQPDYRCSIGEPLFLEIEFGPFFEKQHAHTRTAQPRSLNRRQSWQLAVGSWQLAVGSGCCCCCCASHRIRAALCWIPLCAACAGECECTVSQPHSTLSAALARLARPPHSISSASTTTIILTSARSSQHLWLHLDPPRTFSSCSPDLASTPRPRRTNARTHAHTHPLIRPNLVHTKWRASLQTTTTCSSSC